MASKATSNPKAATMKVLLLGDSGVGKSSLMLRFSSNFFPETISSTIGIDFRVKAVDLGPGAALETVNMQIWDTAGQERFRTLTSSYYRGAHAIIFVYDVTAGATLDGVGHWLKEAQDYCAGRDVVMMLVANKVDRVRARGGADGSAAAPARQGTMDTIDDEDGGGDGEPVEQVAAAGQQPPEEGWDRAEQFAREHRMLLMRCSAKTTEGVVHAFEEVARSVVEKPSFLAGTAGGAGVGRAVNLAADDDDDEGGGPCKC
jgi:small GTP-binding protein